MKYLYRVQLNLICLVTKSEKVIQTSQRKPRGMKVEAGLMKSQMMMTMILTEYSIPLFAASSALLRTSSKIGCGISALSASFVVVVADDDFFVVVSSFSRCSSDNLYVRSNFSGFRKSRLFC